MTLTELRYVITLAKEKHFGRAAKACHVSQPTLSVAINKLEKSLGVAIFERDRNEVRITKIGKQLINQAQCVLDEAEKISLIAQSGKSQLNTALRLGAIYTIAPYLFPNIIPNIKKIAPEMPLIIQEDFTENLRTKLRQGELDAIFISLPFSEPGIITKKLYEESFVVLLPKTHSLNKKKAISRQDLIHEEVLLLGEGHCFRNQVIEVCPSCYKNDETQSIEGTSLETLRHMVASGLGITILPSTATQMQFYKTHLCIKPFKGKPPTRIVALAWRMSFTRPKAIQVLIEAIKASEMNGVSLL